jgi:hypothetical protein
VVAVIISDHDGRCVHLFKRTLKAAGWCISTHDDVLFADVGDSVASSCSLLFGIHSSCTAVSPLINLEMQHDGRSARIG